jgi:hypothetical protein
MPERKVALLLRLHKELKDRLVELAKREHRSLNMQIEFLLEQAVPDTVKRLRNDHQVSKGSHGKS